jgi:hypothetical protein
MPFVDLRTFLLFVEKPIRTFSKKINTSKKRENVELHELHKMHSLEKIDMPDRQINSQVKNSRPNK